MRFTVTAVRALALAALALVLSFSVHAGSSGTTTNKMILGDSIFALSGDIEEYLESDLGESIRSYARSGCQMIGGNLICSSRYAVPNQWANATKTGIRTVIFNGGGNDYLIGNRCPSYSVTTCMEQILALEETIAQLASRMRTAGVTKMIFLGYYNAPGATELRAINDYHCQLKAQNYPGLGITFIDTRAAFQGQSSYIASDGIHPSAAGSRVLATMIRGQL